MKLWGGVDFIKTKSITRLEPYNVMFGDCMLIWTTTTTPKKHATFHLVRFLLFRFHNVESWVVLIDWRMWVSKCGSSCGLIPRGSPFRCHCVIYLLFNENVVLQISSPEPPTKMCEIIIRHTAWKMIYEAPHLPHHRSVTPPCHVSLSDICKCRSHVLHNSIHGWSKQHRSYRNYASSPESDFETERFFQCKGGCFDPSKHWYLVISCDTCAILILNYGFWMTLAQDLSKISSL